MTLATTTITGGASVPLTIHQVWDRNLAAYQLAQLLIDADSGFGPLFFAQRAYYDERARIEAEYGSWERARATPDGKARCDRAWQSMSAAEEAANNTRLYPCWSAIRDLVLKPAPDIAAVRLKVDLIAKEEVWNDRELEADCFKLVRADVERLQGAL